MNNEVYKYIGFKRVLIGYRCSKCRGVFQKMWGTVCNECRSDKNVEEKE